MSEALRQYRSLERDLINVRWQHQGLEFEEEEPILEAMEQLWHELDADEQQLLYSEGTKSLIRDSKMGKWYSEIRRQTKRSDGPRTSGPEAE